MFFIIYRLTIKLLEIISKSNLKSILIILLWAQIEIYIFKIVINLVLKEFWKGLKPFSPVYFSLTKKDVLRNRCYTRTCLAKCQTFTCTGALKLHSRQVNSCVDLQVCGFLSLFGFFIVKPNPLKGLQYLVLNCFRVNWTQGPQLLSQQQTKNKTEINKRFFPHSKVKIDWLLQTRKHFRITHNMYFYFFPIGIVIACQFP